MLAEKQGESVQVEEPAYMPRHAGQLLCMCDLPAKYPVNVDCVTYALIIEFCELVLLTGVMNKPTLHLTFIWLGEQIQSVPGGPLLSKPLSFLFVQAA